ncbi:MAG TPA: alpha/beta family hydrolase [Anaeromyxobacter sp.]
MQADVVGPAGRLEALLEDAPDAAFAAVVCHPHPRFGGTMNTHAVHRLAKAVRARGGASLRFNFRGVGRSAGSYAAGDGEAEDARAALDWLAAAKPGLELLACGFSFGAWMAVLAGGGDGRVAGLLLAGLALRAPDLQRFRESSLVRDVAKPVAIVQAEADEFASPDEVRAAIEGSRGPRRLATVKGAKHLFTEDLPALQREAEAALDWLRGGAP